MNQFSKFQIYYEPTNNVKQDETINSLTLCLSDFNFNDNTYKAKLILEIYSKKVNYKKYKIKEIRLGLDKILEKIEKINFNMVYDEIQPNNDKYCIKCDNDEILTNNKEQIQYILDLFEFDNLINTPIEEFKRNSNKLCFIAS